MNWNGKNVLVVGLARSGVAAANFLLEKGASVTVTDSKSVDELSESLGRLKPGARPVLGAHSVQDFIEADLLVLSPGVPSTLPEIRRAVSEGVPVWSEVELAYRHLSGRMSRRAEAPPTLVGVTGSNGKTTTTAWIGHILQTAGEAVEVAGNIGRPLIETAAAAGSGTEPIHVVELSSFQLENIHRFHCGIAALLNLTPDHLDRYHGFDAYARAKQRIFDNQIESDFAVLNGDDPRLVDLPARLKARTVSFSRSREVPEGAFVRNGRIVTRLEGIEEIIMEASALPLKGAHNLENALAAALITRLLDVPPATIAEGLRTFRGVEHRLEPCGRFEGVAYYNDSKATNVDSAAKALQSFSAPLVVIMGGLDKGGDFGALRDRVRECVKTLILIGTASSAIESALEGCAPIEKAGELRAAVRRARQIAREGDVVLLAPACASFDQFDNYEERGKLFKQLVSAWSQEVA